MSNSNKQAYFIGGGLASLAGAVYLLEDGDFKGENIHIIEALPILGGSNDGAGSKKKVSSVVAGVCSTKKPMKTFGN